MLCCYNSAFYLLDYSSACIESGFLMEDGLCLSYSVWMADLRKVDENSALVAVIDLRRKILLCHYFWFNKNCY